RITRDGKHAGRAAVTAELCKTRDDDLSVRLNRNHIDRVDVAKEVSGDLSVVAKLLIERTVGVVARDDEVFDCFRTTEARDCDDDLAVRLNRKGVGAIDIS